MKEKFDFGTLLCNNIAIVKKLFNFSICLHPGVYIVKTNRIPTIVFYRYCSCDNRLDTGHVAKVSLQKTVCSGHTYIFMYFLTTSQANIIVFILSLIYGSKANNNRRGCTLDAVTLRDTAFPVACFVFGGKQTHNLDNMAFKLPSLAALERPKNSLFDGLANFAWSDISDKDVIGKGTFGCVFSAKWRNEDLVVVEKLIRQHERDRRLFVKEAHILNSLRHTSIVELKAVCDSPLAMMMEYVFFYFSPFGLQHRVSSLQDYLDFLSDKETAMTSFACLHSKIAEDVAVGLQFLHDRNIVHRDLKPANVLISSQHYSSSKNQAEIEGFWARNEAIACKLTDFGESRAELQQTATLCHTRTSNVDRGTIPYMAPELLVMVGKTLSLEQLKHCDVWALGMVIFMLLNPDLEMPYQFECNQIPQKTCESFKLELASRARQRQLPTWSSKYSTLQATVLWKLMHHPFGN